MIRLKLNKETTLLIFKGSNCDVSLDAVSMALQGKSLTTTPYLLQILISGVQSFQELNSIYGNWRLHPFGIDWSIILPSILRQQFLKSMVSEHTYNRYINWLDKDNLSLISFLAFMMFFPARMSLYKKAG